MYKKKCITSYNLLNLKFIKIIVLAYVSLKHLERFSLL